MQTLIVSGILDDDGTLNLHIPFTADVPAGPRSTATGDEVVEIELLDDRGAVLGQTLVEATLLCQVPTAAPSPPPRRMFTGAATLPDGTTGLRLRWRGGVIYEAQAPAGSPVVRFTWQPPDGGVVSGPQHVTWDASHPDGVPMHFFLVSETAEGTRLAVASLLASEGNLEAASQVDVDADSLPPGTVSLVVIAGDGFHQASDQSQPFTVVPGAAV